MRLAPALFLLLAAPALAQDPIPDTTAAWRYFPLAVGNVWEYERESQPQGDPDVYRSIIHEEVIGDTLIVGQPFLVVATTVTRIEPEPRPPLTLYEGLRFDTLAATVIHEYGHPLNAGCRSDEPFPLHPDLEREIFCDDAMDASLRGGYDQEVVVGDDTVTTAVKEYGYWDGAQTVARFAANIGLVYLRGEEFGYSKKTLRYARVGGFEYGEPIVLSSEPAAPGADFALTTYPNPMRGIATLALSMPTPQAVTVEVFDALGRRVYREAHAATGATSLPLDGRAWKPGVYVVRVTTRDGAHATVRLVRR